MYLQLSGEERRAFAARQRIDAASRRYLRLVCAYLDHEERLLTPALIDELTSETGADTHTAVCAALSAAFGLEDGPEEDRLLDRVYLPASVTLPDPATYRSDPYAVTVEVPRRTCGTWTLTRETYAPYEGFVCGPLRIGPHGEEMPPLGFFREEFSFPAVTQDGRDWMSVKPNEIDTMRAPLAAARGRVLTFGLGMGYFAFMASEKADVTAVTVVERDSRVIRLFRDWLLPQFPHRDKISVVEADAFDYIRTTLPRDPHDFAFADIWRDTSDGFPLYLRFLRALAPYPAMERAYWIEDLFLSRLRADRLARLAAALARTDGPLPGDTVIAGLDGVRAALSDTALRLAAQEEYHA